MWIEEQVRLGFDEILDRNVFCILCKYELVRTKQVPGIYRHIHSGLVTCDEGLTLKNSRAMKRLNKK